MSSDERHAKLEEELLRCALDGNFGRVRELVETHRVNVNCVSRFGRTPLMRAAQAGHFRIARFLLENGADVRAVDNRGETAVSRAVFDGNVAMAQLLLESGANVDARTVLSLFDYSLLGWAIYKGMVDMVALLLRFRANTQETLFGAKTYSALYLACWKSSLEIVQLLLDHDDGVDINAFVPRGHEYYGSPAMSPLCKVLCQQGNWRRNKFETVQLLIQRGARLFYNGVYPDSPCPVVQALKHENTALLRLLLDQTNLQQEVGNDNYPLSLALEKAVWWNKLEAAQLLVDCGANVNDRAFCLLHRFARYGMGEGRVCFLLRAGANVNLAERASGETPLWAAAETGNAETVKILLEAEANVKICDNHGDTPLEVARRNGHKRIVYLLLRTSPHVWRKLAVLLVNTPPANE